VAARTAVQAHRGSPDPASGVVENTLEAFHRARELGADGVELDVRLTADGGLAVHHDAVVPGAGPVHELATADLPDRVPLLADALEACTGMLVNIEIKNQPGEAAFDPTERASGLVVGVVEELGRSGTVVVSSFWSAALAAVRTAGPRLACGLLVVPSFDPGSSIEAAVGLGCTAVHLPVGSVDGPTVDAAHRVGLAVAAWTVADDVTLAAMLDAGVDTVITDDVARARRAVDAA
jgi:glycerophosphoryl diester phosphodiesterase